MTATAQRGRPWLPQHDQFLIDNWDTRTLSDLAGILNRGLANTSRRAKRLGLPAKARHFSSAEDAFLKENYGRATTAWIARSIGRSQTSCVQRASLLGLTR